MAMKTLYATGGFKYQNRMLTTGDEVQMDGPTARLYLALNKVTAEKPKGSNKILGNEIVYGGAEESAKSKRKAAPRKRKPAAKKK